MGNVIPFKSKMADEVVPDKSKLMIGIDNEFVTVLNKLVAEHIESHPSMPSLNIDRLKYITDRVYDLSVLKYNREMR